jgi:CheY-like chemotaxis protein
MVVDDEDAARQALSNFIRMLGHVVQYEANSGERALEIFDPLGVDIVFMDMHMPGINGTETVAKMMRIIDQKGCEVRPAFIFIFSPKGCGQMTSMAGLYDGILPKPFKLEILEGILSTRPIRNYHH